MKYASIVIDLLIATVVGAISSIWAQGIVSFLIGLVTFFAVEMTRLSIWAKKINEQYESVSAFLKAVETSDKFSELILLYGLRPFGKASKSSISVERDHVWEFWKDCIARAQSKWSVATYADPGETWFLAWGDQALAIQKERLMSNCNIERIFIVDSEGEKNRLQNIMKRNKDEGIKVSWVLKDEIISHPIINDCIQSLGTLDIAVVDDSWVYRTYLNDQRKLIRSSATKEAEVCEKAKALIREIQGIAKERGQVL